jgi:hypothetical protein
MNWLPSPRALIIFGFLLALFVAAYWACAGHAEIRTMHEHHQERTASVAFRAASRRSQRDSQTALHLIERHWA